MRHQILYQKYYLMLCLFSYYLLYRLVWVILSWYSMVDHLSMYPVNTICVTIYFSNSVNILHPYLKYISFRSTRFVLHYICFPAFHHSSILKCLLSPKIILYWGKFWAKLDWIRALSCYGYILLKFIWYFSPPSR